jgi:hypothetical protein
MFIVRKHARDSKSETIAQNTTYNQTWDEALTFLQENGRDYEAFDMVEVDRKGRVIELVDTVSWESRG